MDTCNDNAKLTELVEELTNLKNDYDILREQVKYLQQWVYELTWRKSLYLDKTNIDNFEK